VKCGREVVAGAATAQWYRNGTPQGAAARYAWAVLDLLSFAFAFSRSLFGLKEFVAMTRKIIALLGLAAVVLCTSPALAEDVMLSQLYGSGVHRYFAGDTTNAHSDFTAAITGGTNDPRPYYFRALSNLRMGRQYEAQADMQRGAELEAADVHGSFQVSKSLERVQGGSRQTLERYRKSARATAYARAEQLRRERYTKARELDRARVRRAAASAPAPLVQDREPRPMPRGADDAAVPAPRTRAEAAATPPAAVDGDPFGAQAPAPAARAADASPFDDAAPPRPGANPFGDDAAPPAPDAVPATAPRGAESADPFGAAVPAATNPFEAAAAAGGAAPAPIAADDAAAPPARPSTRPATNDPFGGDAAPVTPEMPAERANPVRAAPAPPAAGDTDPFGAATPPADSAPANAAPPAAGDADPFGAAAPAADSPPASASPAAAAGDADPFGAAAAPAASPSPSGNAAQPANAGGGGGAAGGLFRAVGRVAEGEAQGKARSWGGALGRYMPFGSRSETTTIERSEARPLPPGAPFDNAAPPTGAVPEGADPFGAPSPPAPGAPAGDADPFGAPAAAGDAGEMKKELKGDPFADDPVQPGDNPFEGKR
jgi:hypothetical protein